MSRCIQNACIHASDHHFVRESDKEEQGERKPRKKVGAKKVTLFIVVILLTIVLLLAFLQQSSLLNKKPPDFDIYEQIERINSEKDEDEKYLIETMDWNVLKKQADAVGIVSVEMDSWDEFKESLRQQGIFVRELGLDDQHGVVWFINGPLLYYRYK